MNDYPHKMDKKGIYMEQTESKYYLMGDIRPLEYYDIMAVIGKQRHVVKEIEDTGDFEVEIAGDPKILVPKILAYKAERIRRLAYSDLQMTVDNLTITAEEDIINEPMSERMKLRYTIKEQAALEGDELFFEGEAKIKNTTNKAIIQSVIDKAKTYRKEFRKWVSAIETYRMKIHELNNNGKHDLALFINNRVRSNKKSITPKTNIDKYFKECVKEYNENK